VNGVVLVMRELVRWLFCVFSEEKPLSLHPVRQTVGWFSLVGVTVVWLCYLSFAFRNALMFMLRVLCFLLCV